MLGSGRFEKLDFGLDDLDKYGSSFRSPARKGTRARTGQLSDLFDKEVLAELEYEFANSSTVQNSLSTQEFRALLSKYIPLNLVDDMYRSIDVNDMGYITYSDFTNYLITSEEGSAFSSSAYAMRLVQSTEQGEHSNWSHRDMIDCLVYVKKPCAMIITGGRDGQLSLWNAETLELITHILHRDKNSVYTEELYQYMDKILKAKCSKMNTGNSKRKNSKVAITCLCPMLNTGLLCVGSADGGVTIYDIGTQVRDVLKILVVPSTEAGGIPA
jgi:WD40 repeat protein